MADVVLELRNVTRTYASSAGELDVLRGADLTLRAGELVGLVGPSGSGKSTLLHLAGLLEPPQSGNVLLEGVECYSEEKSKTLPVLRKALSFIDVIKTPLRFIPGLTGLLNLVLFPIRVPILLLIERIEGKSDRMRTNLRRHKLGFIYQFHHLLAEFSAEDNIAMPLMIAGVGRKEARANADALLGEMGLSDRGHHQPGQLSGGEQQRVAIARALANDPRLVIADEPTGNLDPDTTERVFATLIKMARSEGAAVLVATHNMSLIKHMDRVLTLKDGKLVEYVA